MVLQIILRRIKVNQLRISILLLLTLVLISGCDQETVGTITPTPAMTSTVKKHAVEKIEYIRARETLVEEAVQRQNLQDEDVIRALGSVPRQRFVPPEYEDNAYEDHPLPIGFGQTISQPSLVAWMTELLELEPGDKVLEIGTGSGYQAAILAELGYVEVYSIEIVPELSERSTEILEELGYENVQVKQGDGYYGWEEHSPFDAIIVTAAPDHLPAPLAEQLAEGGTLVIPIGPPGFYQTLWKFVKQNGELTAHNMGSVIFVPFTGSGTSDAAEQSPTP